jgi:hypothetical protein
MNYDDINVDLTAGDENILSFTARLWYSHGELYRVEAHGKDIPKEYWWVLLTGLIEIGESDQED